jgi:hypothetical protein
MNMTASQCGFTNSIMADARSSGDGQRDKFAWRFASACAFIVNNIIKEIFSRRALFCGEPVNSVHNKSVAAKNIRLSVRRSR